MIRYKTERIKEEWNSGKVSKRVKALTNMVGAYSILEFGIEILLTGIYRHQAEQDDIYKDNPRYQEKPWKSVHQYWNGVDLRTSIYTGEQVNKLQAFANQIIYDPKRPHKNTCIVHEVGDHGLHFHLQVM